MSFIRPPKTNPMTTVTEEDISYRGEEAMYRWASGLVNICVVGSRTFTDYKVLSSVLGVLPMNCPIVSTADTNQFICGGARGADSLGEKWANDRKLPTVSVLPDWGQHGKAAGFIRNVKMALLTDVLVAFWDGKSNGTRHMLRTCRDGINKRCPKHPIQMFLHTPDGSLWWNEQPTTEPPYTYEDHRGEMGAGWLGPNHTNVN